MSKYKITSDPTGGISIPSRIVDFFKIGDFSTREFSIINNLDELSKLKFPDGTEIEYILIAGESEMSIDGGTTCSPKNYKKLDASQLQYTSIRLQVRFFEPNNHRTIGSSQFMPWKAEKGDLSSFIKVEAYPFGNTLAWTMFFAEDDFPTILINQEKIYSLDKKIIKHSFLFATIIPTALIQSLIHFLEVQNNNEEWINTFRDIINNISDQPIPAAHNDYMTKIEWANKLTSSILSKHNPIKKLNSSIQKFENIK